jgi:septal ring factor EnvC (AmiA/AmiB activator)
MNTPISKKLLVLAIGAALAVPLGATAASTTATYTTRVERLDRVERLEKLQKLERLEKEGKLTQTQKAELAAMIAKIQSNSKNHKTDVIGLAIRFDAFLRANPQIAAALEKNPDLINSASFMAQYPALTAWLKVHPYVAKELKANPTDFVKVAVDIQTLASSSIDKLMKSAGVTLGELVRFDAYLASHPAIAKELTSNPSVITSASFLAQHPELASWLKAHPHIAKELKNNPQVFLELSADLYGQLSTMGLVALL